MDFRQVFLGLASPYMIVDADLRYVEVNAAYEQVVGRTRAELLGQRLFDLFPNHDEAGRKLEASFRKVLDKGESDTLAFLRYDIPTPGEPGRFETRYWTAVHTPLRAVDGSVAFIVQNTVDVTELRREQDEAASSSPLGVLLETTLLQRAREAEEAKEAASRDASDLRRVFQQAPYFIAILSGPAHVFTFANDSYRQLAGHRTLIGRRVRDAFPEVAGQGYFEMLDKVFQSGDPVMMEQARVALRPKPDEPLAERWLDFHFHPIFGENRTPIGIFAQGVDRTESYLALAKQKLLLDELNHRVKNTLATVQSIASQTLRTAGLAPGAWEAFEGRLLTLSRAHNLLSSSNWSQSEMRAVLKDVLSPYPADRWRLQGPPVLLSPRMALALSLVFHEMATNAAKYGGFAVDNGRISVDWRLEGPLPERSEPASLLISWVERGRAAVPTPAGSKGGFGSRLKRRTIEGELGGQYFIRIGDVGIEIEIAIPYEPGEPPDAIRRGRLS